MHLDVEYIVYMRLYRYDDMNYTLISTPSIDMKSNVGGNFCEVTGQPNWCGSQMSCDGAPADECPVEHWCVCQWAFASYIERAGGCDKIQKVVCEATNMVALKHYREQAAHSPHIKSALQCLEEKCGLEKAAPSIGAVV